MGVIAATFSTWPGTQRSDHPAVSICLNGKKADDFLKELSLAWATGEKTPLGKLRDRHGMKILLIGGRLEPMLGPSHCRDLCRTQANKATALQDRWPQRIMD